MSATFPTDKDNVIDQLDETYRLELTDEEADRLRKMTQAELLLVTALFARASRKRREVATVLAENEPTDVERDAFIRGATAGT